MNKYSNIHLLNQSKKLLGDLYTLKEGNYKYKSGIVYTESGSLISDKYYFDGNGDIQIDKYGNVRFIIDNGEKCVSKTYLGNIELLNECDKFKNIKVNISKNNSVVSFMSKDKNLEYKISKKDNFKGKWIKEEYGDNLVLKYYTEGSSYIWFKDSKGNISEPIEFYVDCLDAKEVNYDNSVFYCSGSTVIIDSIEWVILEDTSTSIKLMQKEPLKDKFSLCIEGNKNYCYISEPNEFKYTWSKSYINDYLNTMYVKSLSEDMQSKLVTMNICDEYNNNLCDDALCGGFTKEEIENNEWICNNYTASKVKLISYNEFNYVYSNTKYKSALKGNYFAINSYMNNHASSVQNNYEFYILENMYNKLDIRPVIILNK